MEQQTEPIPVFYSYSHLDEEYKIQLEKHLTILKRRGHIKSWDDRKIDPGREWEKEINLNLRNAEIILLLVSANFLASDYCYDIETIFALEQHENMRSVVVPVILKPCLWSQAHFSHLQALPKDGKAITQWPNPDEAWLNVSERIGILVNDVNERKGKTKKLPEETVPATNEKAISDKDTEHYPKQVKPSVVNKYFFGKLLKQATEIIKRNFSNGNPTPFKSALLECFEFYKDFYLSPVVIKNWLAAHVNDQEILKEINSDKIDNILTRLSKDGFVTTKINKQGAVLYKLMLPFGRNKTE